MFKSKQFPYFGRDNEFIYFNIERLAQLEDITGQPIVDCLNDDRTLKTLNFLSRAIAVGLAHQRHNFSTADALKELGEAITSRRYKVGDIAETVQYALYQSGIMGEWFERLGDTKTDEERVEVLKQFKDFFPEIAQLQQAEVQGETAEESEEPKTAKRRKK